LKEYYQFLELQTLIRAKGVEDNYILGGGWGKKKREEVKGKRADPSGGRYYKSQQESFDG